VSKRQEKKETNQAAAEAFVKERRAVQIAIFEQNFETGLRVYQDNKDKLSPEQVVGAYERYRRLDVLRERKVPPSR
jgi:hypothetical protein